MARDPIRVAKGVLRDRIYAGRLNKSGDAFAMKDDVTSDVLKAVIDYIEPGNRVSVTEDGVERWTIEVREVEQ